MPRTKPMINSQRFARQSPEGLRKRVIAAIPEWEKVPRKIRYALALLPVHGSFEAACKELSADFDSVPVGLKKSIKAIVKNWEDVGEYPTHSRTNKQGRTFTLALTNAEIMQQLANEMSVLALAQAESKMNANQAFKMAIDAGWFLNLEAEVEKERAYADDRIAQSLSLRNQPSASNDPSLDIPVFEQEIEVDNLRSAAS